MHAVAERSGPALGVAGASLVVVGLLVDGRLALVAAGIAALVLADALESLRRRRTP